MVTAVIELEPRMEPTEQQAAVSGFAADREASLGLVVGFALEASGYRSGS